MNDKINVDEQDNNNNSNSNSNNEQENDDKKQIYDFSKYGIISVDIINST
jgi:hypothetical protein